MPEFGFPKDARLKKSREFSAVYKEGKRFDGRYMSAFVMRTEADTHKLGITASKKGIGNSIERNRAKRLLREAFRLSKSELGELSGKYEWVLNARRSLLDVKLAEPLEDFRRIIERVKNFEINKGEEHAALETQKPS